MANLSQPTWILPLASDRATLLLVGGKAANLARLARAGLPVPDGFLITTPAYQAFLTANDLTERIMDALSEGMPDSPDQAEKASATCLLGYNSSESSRGNGRSGAEQR
ncbi:MAG: hypothetical protein IPM84_08355 [Anaerolineae bacterium]|nr:hypothetical protein [Anaerolineae bacterium]